MADIELTTPTGNLKAALEIPTGDGPWPGVVVVHDLMGLSPDIRRITRRVADAGFVTMAPDLFSGAGPVKCVRTVIRQVLAQEGPGVDAVLAARTALADRDDCTGMTGVVGFCLGGGFALAVSPKGFDAAAPFYPSVLPLYDRLTERACPIVASFGARDPLNIGSGPRLAKTLDRKGIPNDVKVYHGVGHGFANEMPGQPFLRVTGFGYAADAADDAFARVFAFFDEHLR
jgi:carboxymethylenebutenolidase